MTAPVLERVDEQRYRLCGELTFGTVVKLLRDSRDVFRRGANFTFNLEGVTHSDSAGLALLVEWLRIARENSVKLIFINIPAQMLALARVAGVDGMVSSAVSSNIN